MKYTGLAALAMLPTMGASCTGDSMVEMGPGNGPGLIYHGSWTSGWPNLGHDGDPHESEHFIVFSNGSSPEARKDLAGRAEEVWPVILALFGVSEDDFDWLASYDVRKIHIFADYGQMNMSGLAYRDGIIMRAVDSPRYDQFYTEESYRRVLTHEISHVVEFLLIGTFAYRQANDVWLREGAATYSGGARDPVDTVEELRAWQAQMVDVPGGGNPIGIHTWSDFPVEIRDANRTIEYYPLFQLATRYLLESADIGASPADLVALYDDLGDGIPFPAALAARFGLTLETFEAEFFARTEAFLALERDRRLGGSP